MNGLMNRSSEFIDREDHVRKILVCAKSPSKTLLKLIRVIALKKRELLKSEPFRRHHHHPSLNDLLYTPINSCKLLSQSDLVILPPRSINIYKQEMIIIL